ncbi:hypothetical protein [Bacillus sp. JCM 19041]|uniref:hypothetical protein n=1 Tax=Bacillus sp. JCM 19041 TaxID=1460637 RepID=UPI0012E287F7
MLGASCLFRIIVMDLATTSNHVYCSLGNNDALVKHLLNKNAHLIPYLTKQPNSIFHEMLQEQGVSLNKFPSIDELSTFLFAHYGDELNWLSLLPHAYETEEYIIVHAGLANQPNWRETSINDAISIPFFYEKEHQVDKIVIVGHWPISNYTSTTKSHNNPIIDENKRIICIDGGNQLKRSGQLNALTIEKSNYKNSYVDHLSERRLIIESFISDGQHLGMIVWPHYELEILERSTYFTRCKNKGLGTIQWVKNEYIRQENERTYCVGDVSTTLLDVLKGEMVYMMDSSCNGYDLVKRNGEFGWIPKDTHKKCEE